MGVTEEMFECVDRKAFKWFGHVKKMGDEQLTKQMYKSEVGGVRGRGRPHSRWINGLEDTCKTRNMGFYYIEDEMQESKWVEGWD